MRTHTLTNVLRLDAVGNVAIGAILLLGGGWLAEPLGLETGWLIRIVGAVLVVYGVENQLVARRTSTRGLAALASADIAFAAAMLALAILDPTSAGTWARWGLVLVADVSAGFGIAKLVGLRSLSVQGTARPAEL